MSTNGPRPISKMSIANSISTPTDLIRIPEWDSDENPEAYARVRALPLGHPWYIQYVEGTSPTPQDVALGVRSLPLRDDQMAELYSELLNKQDYPSDREIQIRTAVAATILCTIDEDGNTIFDTDQETIDWFRDGATNYTAALRISARAHQLARPETLEDAKKDLASDPESDSSTPSV